MRHVLEEMDNHWWGVLKQATGDLSAAYRTPTLCSVDAQERPQARTVVLRHVDICVRQLLFYTDIRSAKWTEFDCNPVATVLAYDAMDRVQLRLAGEVQLLAMGDTRHAACWSSLSLHSRANYSGGPPGMELDLSVGQSTQASATDTVESSPGLSRFGALLFTAVSLDFVQLTQENNSRARFAYGEAGALHEASWINP